MITIDQSAVTEQRAAYEANLAAYEQRKGKYYELEKSLLELCNQADQASQKSGELGRARKAARIEAGGKITQAVIELREQQARVNIEIEELAEAQGEIRQGMEEMLPELYELAARVYRAQEALAKAAAASLQERRAALVQELGELVAFELSAKQQGTPFDVLNYRRFGDGSGVDHEEVAAGHLYADLLRIIQDDGCSGQVLADLGIVSIQPGPLRRHQIGDPLAFKKLARG
jgi:hypothetical protein